MRRVLEGFINPFKGKSPRKVIEVTIGVLVMVAASGLFGYTYGYYDATGFPPRFLMQKSYAILPPEVAPVATMEQIKKFIEADDTKLNKYDVGFNSVEYAFLLARNAHWKGLPGEVIKLDFKESDVGHLILAFPVEEGIWVFVDPTSSTIIKPDIGVKLGDRTVVNMWILRAGWEPFKLEFSK